MNNFKACEINKKKSFLENECCDEDHNEAVDKEEDLVEENGNQDPFITSTLLIHFDLEAIP